MRKVSRKWLIAACAVALLAAVALWVVYAASLQAPEFYRQALSASPDMLAEEGEQFERTALELHNQLQHDGHWQTCLTQEEINGWLATDLPAKFPQALPPGLSEPRIAIEEGLFHAAVHFQDGGMDTVVSLSGEAYLTAQPNELALRLQQARAGLVPIPLARFIDEITAWAARSDLPLRWTQVRGAPVAVVRLPMALDGEGQRRLVLDSLELSRGKLMLAGRTQRADAEPPAPSTAGQSGEKAIRQR